MVMSDAPRVLILACGALAKELGHITRQHALGAVTVDYLPAAWHNTPDRIPTEIRNRIRRSKAQFDRILIGYGDCGTGGELDRICADEGVERLPGDHCYQFFAGNERFSAMHHNDPTAFYLTDYLARHHERLIIEGLGIAEHPELRDMYFGNYTKVILLAQTDDPVVDQRARAAALALGLAFERLDVGLGELEDVVVEIARRPTTAPELHEVPS